VSSKRKTRKRAHDTRAGRESRQEITASAWNAGRDGAETEKEKREMSITTEDGDKIDRSGAIAISWGVDGVGAVSLDGVTFARVEWSESRGAWCIEDAAGRCLHHVGSIKGRAASKEEAAALAIDMVRDGRMPSPEQAHAEHAERERIAGPKRKAAREKRRQQPAEIAKREHRAALDKAYHDSIHVEYEARQADEEAGPLYETLASAFNFADPELWRSNSFAMLRPRLVLHVRRAIAELEHKLTYERSRSPNPFSGFWAASADRKEWAAEREAEIASAVAEIEKPLARAREILAQLEARP
jgi:hypothetical protein